MVFNINILLNFSNIINLHCLTLVLCQNKSFLVSKLSYAPVHLVSTSTSARLSANLIFEVRECNDLDPLLADIVLFGLSLSGISSRL